MFIHDHVADFPVQVMCEVLGVSRGGYYAWAGRAESARAADDRALAAEIRAAHEASRGRYGSPRVHAELRARGRRIGRKRVARLMRGMGLAARRRRRFRRTTDSRHAFPIAPNLLERNFTAEAPDRVWLADLTYIWTAQGWLYLAVVLDLYTRRVVGWAMADHLRHELTLAALDMAIVRQRPAPGLVHHADRGVQYAAHGYRARLRRHGMVCSMSRKGDCWDNAPMESFFATLKGELVEASRLRNTRRGQGRPVPIHRGILQPAPLALRARLPHTRAEGSSVPISGFCRVTVSAKAGEAHCTETTPPPILTNLATVPVGSTIPGNDSQALASKTRDIACPGCYRRHKPAQSPVFGGRVSHATQGMIASGTGCSSESAPLQLNRAGFAGGSNLERMGR